MSEVSEPSTVDVAAEKFSYGKEQESVEDKLATIETEQSRVLDDIASGTPPEAHEKSLRDLFWSLSIRTRAVRESLSRAGLSLVRLMAETASSSSAKEALAREVSCTFDARLSEMLDRLPEAARTAMAVPAIRAALREQAMAHLDKLEMGEIIDAVASQPDFDKKLSEASKEGQIRGLRQLLASSITPAMFAPAHWQVIEAAPQSVILGDCCTVSVCLDGSNGTLLRNSKDWTEAYLPIGHDRILVAQRKSGKALLSTDEVNLLSTSVSSEAFYAARVTPYEEELRRKIGSVPGLLTDQELREILADAWDKLGR